MSFPPMASLRKASENPHFFKVVLAHALEEQKLEIPKKFVREHGLRAFLNNQICLKVADGREWDVGVTKSNGRVWFHHGWQKFVEFYSIGLEYFLVFRYEKRSSSFHVIIFDLTATEIEYPTKQICIDEVDEENVKMETSLDDLDLSFYSKEPLDFKVGGVNFSVIKPMIGKHGERKQPLTASQQARAMVEATAFQSMTLNPSFMCKMWPSNIYLAHSLHVPQSFVEVHLEETTEIILQVSDGRTWDARCCLHWTRRIKRRAEVRQGWKKFVQDNKLQVGDACVFEMIRKSSTRIAFKVEIFRNKF